MYRLSIFFRVPVIYSVALLVLRHELLIDEQKKEILIAAFQHFDVVDFLCERSLFP